MAERQISIKSNKVVKLSQQEIADILRLSKVKVNRTISDLKKDGYIVQISPRGTYALTEKSKLVLDLIL